MTIPKMVPMKGRTAPQDGQGDRGFLALLEGDDRVAGREPAKGDPPHDADGRSDAPRQPCDEEVFVVVEVPTLVEEVGEHDTSHAQQEDSSEHAVEVGALRPPVDDVVQVLLDAGALAPQKRQRLGPLLLGPLTRLELG